MIRLTEFALRQKSVIILLAVGMLVAGLFSWGQLRQELLPDIELPFVTVITPLPGAGAEDVATQVTEPIERSLANVPRLKTFSSTSANSLSLVLAQFSFGTDIKETLAIVERQMGQLNLPQGSEPIVSSFDFNNQPVVVATIAAEEGADPVEAARIAREEIVPSLLGIEGVSTADLTGGATAILDIRLDPDAMADTGISLQQVQGRLFANDITIPSGAITEGGLRLPVSTQNRFTSVEELEELIVGARGGGGAAAPGSAPGGLAAKQSDTDAAPAGTLQEQSASIPMPLSARRPPKYPKNTETWLKKLTVSLSSTGKPYPLTIIN